jgi:hypothetical protein
MQRGAVSNIDSFLLRDTCVSSTYLNSPIWRKQTLSPCETPELQKVFLSKL